MKHLKAVNKYFWKYRYRLAAGVVFILMSNYLAVLTPQITAFVVDKVQALLPGGENNIPSRQSDVLVNYFIAWVNGLDWTFGQIVALCSITILVLAILRGVFMFFMRQTIIVMSRYIEFDQKNEVYHQYQRLDSSFYKMHSIGDLMNRITEDVSRVRQYAGPAIMYLVNLISMLVFAIANMLAKNVELTLYVLAPLPLLAFVIFRVNTIIHRKSEIVQQRMSDLTTNAQQSYSGIRVIKSYVQEVLMLDFFRDNSKQYRKNAIGLAQVDAYYFPTIQLLIGISTLVTIMIGGIYFLNGRINSIGTLIEFVLYINMLQFPVGAIGWVASIIQRASASQKRLNEFLQLTPEVMDGDLEKIYPHSAVICFENVDFTYTNTGIKAMKNVNFEVQKGNMVAIMGKTGSGKSTIAQLLLRFFDPDHGQVKVYGKNVKDYELETLREAISYVPQEVFLFSDTIANNIRFGNENTTMEEVVEAARAASIHEEILEFSKGYDTLVGERGVTLSGGQKQRISIARALLKKADIIILDDCLSAVDVHTEQVVLGNLRKNLQNKTVLMITHRIFQTMEYDRIMVFDNGYLEESGTQAELLKRNGLYRDMYDKQQESLASEA